MRIQHNIMAMSAYRNYTNNVSAMKKNLEKLSSGYKINRAGDDAAGLAISEKMRAQITGLETAQKNAKDGISLVQTAEGALTEVHDMLNRMVELATMSANGTYDNDVDRAQLQKEMDQLTSEINRIADSANFNGIKLLDGSMDASGATTVYNDLDSSAIQDLMLTGESTSAADVGTKTILESDAGPSAKPTFEVSLDGVSHIVKDGQAGSKIEIDVGGKTFSLTEAQMTGKTAGDTVSDEELASFFAENAAATKIGNFTYDVTADGNKLVFTAQEDATQKTMEHYTVTMTGVTGGTNAAKAEVYTTGKYEAGTLGTPASKSTDASDTKAANELNDATITVKAKATADSDEITFTATVAGDASKSVSSARKNGLPSARRRNSRRNFRVPKNFIGTSSGSSWGTRWNPRNCSLKRSWAG